MNSEFEIRNSELPPTRPSHSSRRRQCVVGLTGGLASGKSTVARELETRGVSVLDADVVVSELYESGAPGAAAVFELFGTSVLENHGGVDRSALAALVLNDDAARLSLEKAIHPLVRDEIQRWIKDLGEVPIAVVEAALLVETGSYRQYDVLVVVWCEQHQQLDRAISRGVPRDRAKGLLDAQLPLDEKRELAEVVIDNSGPIEDLEAEINRSWKDICRICNDRRSGDSHEKFRIPNSEFRIR